MLSDEMPRFALGGRGDKLESRCMPKVLVLTIPHWRISTMRRPSAEGPISSQGRPFLDTRRRDERGVDRPAKPMLAT